MEYTFKFSGDQAKIVHVALLELPARVSYDVITEFRKQATAQDSCVDQRGVLAQSDAGTNKL